MALFQAVCERGCEGVVAKCNLGIYSAAGTVTWLKIRNPNYTQIRGRHEMFKELMALSET
jgi:ATP-dependent DNA ligase